MGQGDIWSPPCAIVLHWRRCLANISGNWTWFIPTATTGTFVISLFSILIGSSSFPWWYSALWMYDWCTCYFLLTVIKENENKKSPAIAKMTARCALYMDALKNFRSPWLRPQLLFPKLLMTVVVIDRMKVHQMANVGVSQSRGLKLFSREIIFEEFQPMWSRYLNITDRQTDNIRSQYHALHWSASCGKNVQ